MGWVISSREIMIIDYRQSDRSCSLMDCHEEKLRKHSLLERVGVVIRYWPGQ